MKFIILGCGSSMGVPRADGFFGNCNPKNKKNYRTRCSALIKDKNYNVLIDTSPDLRFQLLNNKIKNVNKVLYSHLHADQTHGINDLRLFYLKSKKKIDVFADKLTKNYLLKTFSYCFKRKKDYPPILKLKSIKKIMTFNKTIKIKTIPVKHGRINCISFIINNKIGYASDVNEIYKKDLKHFSGLDYLVLDCLKFTYHPSHFSLDDILELNNFLKPKKLFLTNMHNELDYDYLLKSLPKNIKPAYDGLSLNFN